MHLTNTIDPLIDTFSNTCYHKPKKEIGGDIMKRVTIQDIADALGMSRNTVSKALNNSDGLADATREKILQKAAEMGYKQFSYVSAFLEQTGRAPAVSAESPKGPGEVALFTTTIFHQGHHFASLMLDSLKRELAQCGYILSIHIVDSGDLSRKTLPATFSKERCVAIMCLEMFDWDYDRMVCNLGIPVLFVDGPHKRFGNSLPADQLYMENTVGITQLVNDMLRKGKRKIGFIGDYEHCQSFYERYTAFRCAMLMAGVPVDEQFCIKENLYEDMLAPISALPELPDLFICENDFVAVHAIQVLQKLGKSVPEDVMMAGFDDSPESRIMTPSLTTVHIHTQIMAYTAANLLTTRIKEPSLDYRIVYTETDLIYRDSTKCQETEGI